MLKAMGNYEKLQKKKEMQTENEMESKIQKIDKLMDKKKRTRIIKKEKEHNDRDNDKDSSMESIQPLGNLSSAGNNDDG